MIYRERGSGLTLEQSGVPVLTLNLPAGNWLVFGTVNTVNLAFAGDDTTPVTCFINPTGRNVDIETADVRTGRSLISLMAPHSTVTPSSVTLHCGSGEGKAAVDYAYLYALQVGTLVSQ